MHQVPIPESDDALLAQCDVETFRAGGPGGQHQNKTESAVRLTHRPSGIVVTARRERSQHANKAMALLTLRERLVQKNRRRKKRIPTRIPKSKVQSRLQDKAAHSEKKRARSRPRTDE